MIIEAGYDLFELFAPKIFAKPRAKGRHGTWVLALDENLRNQHLTKVGGDASDVIENRIHKVVTCGDECVHVCGANDMLES
ncbi:hypothetical protein BKA04_001961 [Cryobacterium mesophilum]|uniref:Uncharacterized protein n=1 Tax=Terrimesophilobacter mesophilus TaxID=433647 RepID=A0A4R8VE29_9MICO|nr:hypothetical protein [Terrimesophilobacter mesophilus]MBB5633738.1 hypothetical protein [Terrimesophilobacter mesophilus]TFB80420.1 hypothetical protein E3N84_10500 [Terrimesophilobacter mesophilus]